MFHAQSWNCCCYCKKGENKWQRVFFGNEYITGPRVDMKAWPSTDSITQRKHIEWAHLCNGKSEVMWRKAFQHWITTISEIKNSKVWESDIYLSRGKSSHCLWDSGPGCAGGPYGYVRMPPPCPQMHTKYNDFSQGQFLHPWNEDDYCAGFCRVDMKIEWVLLAHSGQGLLCFVFVIAVIITITMLDSCTI